MLIYEDIFTGDEMISDAYRLTLVDDIVFEADCAMVAVGGEDIDFGGNPSAEDGPGEDYSTAVETVNNIVHAFKLQETEFDKKSYMSYIKGYMKRVKTHLEETNPERVPKFQEAAMAFVKKILGKIGDLQFFIGESFDCEAMVVIMDYRPDNITPFVMFFKDGLKEIKC